MSNPTFIINDLMNHTSRSGEYMHELLPAEAFNAICKRISGNDKYDVCYIKSEYWQADTVGIR